MAAENVDGAWGSWELTAVNQDAVHDPPLATLRYSNLESVLQRVRTTLSRHEEDIKKPVWLDSLQRQIDTVQANIDEALKQIATLRLSWPKLCTALNTTKAARLVLNAYRLDARRTFVENLRHPPSLRTFATRLGSLG